jgi:anti-sigma-K factor RskA
VWQAISREARSVVPFAGRLPPAATPPQEVAIWRRSTMRDNWRQLATAAVMLLAIYLVVDISLFTPSPAGAPALEVTINDETALPAWSVRLDRERRLLSVSIIRTQTIAAANSFELWMLPGEGPDQAPVSLGLIPASGEISLRLTAELAAALVAAGGLAVSLEPAGGSPTGQPTGPILYQGVIEPAA